MKKWTKDSHLIKAEIKRVHDRGSSDFQTLLQQVEKRQKKINLNLPQLIAARSRAIERYLEWGRGTGKTTFIGYLISELLAEMPRSTGIFIGPSYQFILTRIIPSLVQGLEMFGIYEGLHYFIGERPPRSWRRTWGTAYQPPKKYNNYITFWNGMGIHLISHDVKGDGRGLNTDWIAGDEAALLDPRKLQENTDPTLRGTSKHKFKKSWLFGSRTYTSSTPLTPEGGWFIKKEELATQKPKKVNFISATAKHNAHNLRDGYLEEAERNAYAYWVYLAEYENVRPKFTRNSFYPLLDKDIHCYHDYDYTHYTKIGQAVDCRGDADLVKGVPLILGIDWGATINCLTVNQHLQSIQEFRTLKSMFVLGEDQKIQDDLFQEFHDYYQYHNEQVVYLHYDNTGNNKTGNTRRNRAEQARDQLIKLGWKVVLMSTGGANVSHEDKHILWNAILKEDNPRLPRYRMNKANCRELYLSMRNAKTKIGRDGSVHKDKSSEKSSKILRQEATDLSDANDTPMYNLFNYLLNGYGMLLPPTSTS